MSSFYGNVIIGNGSDDGGGSGFNDKAPENDVNFIDYDGSILYSYSADDFLNLTEMPANPSHEGLVAKGWGWTLEEAKDFVTRNGVHTLGQQYVTDNNRFRFHIKIDTETETGMTFGVKIKGNSTIYWGDNNITETTSSTATVYSHLYTELNNYIVEIENKTPSNQITVNTEKNPESIIEINFPESGFIIPSQPFTGSYFLEKYSYWDNPSFKLFFGGSVFWSCYSLKAAIYSPLQGDSAFAHCTSLERIAAATAQGETIEKANTSRAFQQCPSLKMGVLHNNGRNINQYFCYEDFSLTKITLSPRSSIYENAFYNCRKLKEVHLKGSQVIGMSKTNAFYNLPKTCLIYVPMDLVDAYKNATNWSTYASQIVGE